MIGGWGSHRWRRCIGRVAIAAAALVSGTAPCAFAHRTPMLLALWGGFEASPAKCQRRIGVVTAQCADAARRARDVCLATQIAGSTCDRAATDAMVAQIRAATLGAVDHDCNSDDLQPLGFLSSLDLDADVDSSCMGADTALVSAVYSPMFHPHAANESVPACVAATARAAGKLLHFAFRARRHALDRIALKSLGPSKKQMLIDLTEPLIDRARERLEPFVRGMCSDADFMSVYGRDLATFLMGIAQRADCLAAAGYVQAAVVCPKPVCGNGIQESGEQCDDGNTIDGDGCHSNCTLESQP